MLREVALFHLFVAAVTTLYHKVLAVLRHALPGSKAPTMVKRDIRKGVKTTIDTDQAPAPAQVGQAVGQVATQAAQAAQQMAPQVKAMTHEHGITLIKSVVTLAEEGMMDAEKAWPAIKKIISFF